jgi:hypothetical protein
MGFSTGLILLLLLVVAVLIFYIYYVPPKMVTIVERPVYDYGVSWVPWSWGAGAWGWPGSTYVNRPVPHYGPGPRGGGGGGGGNDQHLLGPGGTRKY